MPSNFVYSLDETAADAVFSGQLPKLLHPHAFEASKHPLGFGLVAPFQRDGRGDFAAKGGVEKIAANVAQILATDCATPDGAFGGELPWRPEFGSLLRLLRHRNMDDPTTQQLARVYIGDALKLWEPRVRLRATRLVSQASRGSAQLDTMNIALRYAIVGSGDGSAAVIADAIGQVVVVTQA